MAVADQGVISQRPVSLNHRAPDWLRGPGRILTVTGRLLTQHRRYFLNVDVSDFPPAPTVSAGVRAFVAGYIASARSTAGRRGPSRGHLSHKRRELSHERTTARQVSSAESE